MLQINARKTCKNVECGETFAKKSNPNLYWEGIAKKGMVNVTSQKDKLQYRVSFINPHILFTICNHVLRWYATKDNFFLIQTQLK